MSVLSCSRNECGNVMCDRYSERYGYICERCFDELVMSGPMTNIAEFMKTTPNEMFNVDEALARYNAVFFVVDEED